MEFTQETLQMLQQNFMALPEEEKQLFREFMQSPMADVVVQVLGLPAEFLAQGRQLTRSPEMAQPAPAPALADAPGLMGRFE